MKYLEKFLRNNSSNQLSAVSVRGKSFSQVREIDKKDCEAGPRLQCETQKVDKMHNDNAAIAQLASHTSNNVQNTKLEKCVSPKPTIPTLETGLSIDDMTCQEIIAQVKQQSEDYQTQWWLALSQWLTTGAGEIAWRCFVFEQLSDCWDRRQDFELAKTMFTGIGSRVIVNEQVTENLGAKQQNA